MKIKMITQASGPTCSLKAGEVYEVGVAPGLTAEFATALLDGGYARPHEEKAVPTDVGETAVEGSERKKKSNKKKARKAKKS